MRVHRDHWPLRLLGSAFGVGCGAMGGYSLVGSYWLAEIDHGRAFGFGITALVVGGTALLGSLTASNVRGLWYCSPRRWQMFKNQ